MKQAAASVGFVELTLAALPVLTRLAREYCRENGETFREDCHGRALALLAQGDPFARAWLIDISGATEGYVVVNLGFSVECGGREAFIDELYVRPGHRGRGVGRRALDFAEAELRRLGARAVHLMVERRKDGLRDFYRRVGFVDRERFVLSKELL